LKYIARVDNFDDEEEYEGDSCKRLTVNSKVTQGKDTEEHLFIVNEEDGAPFAPTDIALKLPTPLALGGSTWRNKQLRFQLNFSALDLVSACICKQALWLSCGSCGPQLAFYFTYFQNSRNFVVLENALRTSMVPRPKLVRCLHCSVGLSYCFFFWKIVLQLMLN